MKKNKAFTKEIRGQKNKNPFNIKRSDSNSWIGKIVQSDGSFALDKDFEVFDSFVYGVRAGMYLICKYIFDYNVSSLESLIHRFCPDGNVIEANYCRFIREYTQYSYNDLPEITYPHFVKLCRAICMFESTYKIPDNVLNLSFSMLPLKYKDMFNSILRKDEKV